MSKPNKITLTSPRGPAIYPKLNAPDYKFDAAGKYGTKLALNGSDAEAQAFVAKLEKVRDDFYDEKVAELRAEKKAALAMEIKKADVVQVERDQDSGEQTGRLILNTSMKASGTRKDGSTWTQSPAIFDAKGTELKNPPAIWGGSELKASVEIEGYLMPSTKTVGVSVRLKGVQILKLVSAGNRSFDGLGFQAEDGDEIADAAPQTFGDETSSTGSSGHDDL